MKKLYVSWNDVQRQVQSIIRQMTLDSWKPDYVVGITRGGLVPATLISHYLQCPMETLQVRINDGVPGECESNLWMPEDAVAGKKILVVDDLKTTGNTLNWLITDWSGSVFNGQWDMIWHNNVKFAALYNCAHSNRSIDVDYSAADISNESGEEVDIVFPWEDFWCR